MPFSPHATTHAATLITLPSPAVCSPKTSYSPPRSAYTTTSTTIRKPSSSATPIWRQLLSTIIFLLIFALYLCIHAAFGATAILLGWAMLRQSLDVELSTKELALIGAIGGSLAFLVQIITLQFALFDWLYAKSQGEDSSTAYKIVLVLYTKTCALINGLTLGLIGGALLQPNHLGWMVLAGFLGVEVFVLVGSLVQGLVLWRKRKLEGVWVLEWCNLVPHHLACAMDAWDYYVR